MTSGVKWLVGILLIMATAVVVMILWPASDPLAGVDSVAIRVRDDSASTHSFDFEAELGLVLSGRNIRVVSDEAAADLVLSLDELRVNLGDIEISLTDGTLRGKASAVCIVTDVRTGETHTMDFTIQVENGDVRAALVGRKFWQFWK